MWFGWVDGRREGTLSRWNAGRVVSGDEGDGDLRQEVGLCYLEASEQLSHAPSAWASVRPRWLLMLWPIANTESVSKPSPRKYACWNVHCQECTCHVMCYRRSHQRERDQTFRNGGGVELCLGIGNARVAHVAGWRLKRVSSEHSIHV